MRFVATLALLGILTPALASSSGAIPAPALVSLEIHPFLKTIDGVSFPAYEVVLPTVGLNHPEAHEIRCGFGDNARVGEPVCPTSDVTRGNLRFGLVSASAYRDADAGDGRINAGATAWIGGTIEARIAQGPLVTWVRCTNIVAGVSASCTAGGDASGYQTGWMYFLDARSYGGVGKYSVFAVS